MSRLETVTIAVHPVSYRVLTAVYGQQPITVERLDLLFSMLSRGRTYRVRDEQLAELRMQVELRTTPELAQRIRRRGPTVGIQLAQFHMDWMCSHTAAVVRHHGEATAAIRDWYARYGIHEDDYAADSAYKRWQRYVWAGEKKSRFFFEKKGREKDSPFSNIIMVGGRPQKAWSDDEIETAAQKLHELADCCLSRVPARLGDQIRTYVHAVRSARKGVETARAMGVAPSTAHYRVSTVRDWLSVDAVAREMFERILSERPKT